MQNRPYSITCDAVGPQGFEIFDAPNQGKRLISASGNTSLLDAARDLTDNAKFWLPIAAEKLNISKDIKDYILTPVISMPSDLPNRNGQAFPYTELTAWCIDGGAPMYKTWIGKSAYKEHANDDPWQSKGVIVECMMRPIENTSGNIWKVVKLIAWDRTKDPMLVNDILANKRNCYSMGAHAADFSCSVCSSLLSKGGCEHVTHGKPKYNIVNGKLAYYNCIDTLGFECSSVASPAYSSASNMPYMAWLT
ncbi:MAG: hypothetical protein KGH75_10995 [Rhodospirillales bacterium]|nr:hypothetical protein [Rhodospirillales bacterium]